MTWRNATSTCADHTYSVMVEVSITLSWIFFFFGGIAFAFAALQGSIDEGACTHNCGGPCVFCGRLCCGAACCPTDEEIAMRKQQQLQRDRERQAQMDQQGGQQQQQPVYALLGALPGSDQMISWQGHLGGLISGG